MNAQTAQPTAAQPSAQPHTNGTLSLNEQLALVCKERDEANARAQQAEKAAKEAREAAAHPVGKPSVKARRTDRKYVDGKTGEEVPGKGNVAVYGLQRMPVTLYPNQWVRLFAMRDEVLAAIEANRDGLSFAKGE